VPEFAGLVLEKLSGMDVSQADAAKVATIIRQRCEHTIADFPS